MAVRQQRRRELRAWILAHRRSSLADAFSAWADRPSHIVPPGGVVDAARGILHLLWVRASTARIRQLLRVDKVQFFVALAHQAQAAAENNDQRTLYACVRRSASRNPYLRLS